MKVIQPNLLLDSVKEKDGSLGLDGDVAAQLDDPFVLVVSGIQKPEQKTRSI